MKSLTSLAEHVNNCFFCIVVVMSGLQKCCTLSSSAAGDHKWQKQISYPVDIVSTLKYLANLHLWIYTVNCHSGFLHFCTRHDFVMGEGEWQTFVKTEWGKTLLKHHLFLDWPQKYEVNRKRKLVFVWSLFCHRANRKPPSFELCASHKAVKKEKNVKK